MAITIGGPTRPAFVRNEHLDYLDELFESYAVDPRRVSPPSTVSKRRHRILSAMLGLVFRLGEREAGAIVEFWRSTFGRRLTRS